MMIVLLLFLQKQNCVGGLYTDFGCPILQMVDEMVYAWAHKVCVRKLHQNYV
jgi:hypothetical protein